MVVLTPVARDPLLLCLAVSAPVWKNSSARRISHKKQPDGTLTRGRWLHAFALLMHLRRYLAFHPNSYATLPACRASAFGWEI